jgi:hypothetical protein
LSIDDQPICYYDAGRLGSLEKLKRQIEIPFKTLKISSISKPLDKSDFVYNFKRFYHFFGQLQIEIEDRHEVSLFTRISIFLNL